MLSRFTEPTRQKQLSMHADSGTYVNPDPAQQALVREILYDFGMVVVLPRRPLERGASYHVTMEVNKREYEWSFLTPRVKP